MSTESVHVVVRLRPPTHPERAAGAGIAVHTVSPRALQVALPHSDGAKQFEFPVTAGPGVGQAEFYDVAGVRDLIDTAFDGYNVAILAYGMTAAGKTHTMLGESSPGMQLMQPLDTDGIIPRALHEIFATVQDAEPGQYSVALSYMEVYNEQVFDLLREVDMAAQRAAGAASHTLQGGPHALPVRGDGRSYWVEGLLEIRADSMQDVAAVLAAGHAARRVRGHRLNDRSSRSHALLGVTLTNARAGTQARLTFVDLAGSERLKGATGSGSTGEGAKETAAINRSLLALVNVVNALSGAAKAKPRRPSLATAAAAVLVGKTSHSSRKSSPGVDEPSTPLLPKSTPGPGRHVPYRDSVLTKLLMDSLGGTARTLFITCISPVDLHCEETLRSLTYAQRCGAIDNAPIVHSAAAEGQRLAVIQRRLEELEMENAMLREQVAAVNRSATAGPAQQRSPPYTPHPADHRAVATAGKLARKVTMAGAAAHLSFPASTSHTGRQPAADFWSPAATALADTHSPGFPGGSPSEARSPAQGLQPTQARIVSGSSTGSSAPVSTRSMGAVSTSRSHYPSARRRFAPAGAVAPNDSAGYPSGRSSRTHRPAHLHVSTDNISPKESSSSRASNESGPRSTRPAMRAAGAALVGGHAALPAYPATTSGASADRAIWLRQNATAQLSELDEAIKEERTAAVRLHDASARAPRSTRARISSAQTTAEAAAPTTDAKPRTGPGTQARFASLAVPSISPSLSALQARISASSAGSSPALPSGAQSGASGATDPYAHPVNNSHAPTTAAADYRAVATPTPRTQRLQALESQNSVLSKRVANLQQRELELIMRIGQGSSRAE